MNIPESYKPGVERIERMNAPALRVWLEAELREQTHILSGKAEAFPVQAIVNHHPYLSVAAQKRVSNVIEAIIFDWRHEPNTWPETAVRALLSLAAELRVAGAKSKLQSLVSNKAEFSHIASSLHPAVFRAIATLSSSYDRTFWSKFPVRNSEFAGMAFQVLARIAPEDALDLIGRLPDNETVIGSVARKLPAFVSQFEPPRTSAVLQQISNALAHLSTASAAALSLALKETGFILPPSPIASQPLVYFKQQIAKLSVYWCNSAPLHHKAAKHA